eukprot:708457-Lingulodinium_polyedra.AAC.1
MRVADVPGGGGQGPASVAAGRRVDVVRAAHDRSARELLDPQPLLPDPPPQQQVLGAQGPDVH